MYFKVQKCLTDPYLLSTNVRHDRKKENANFTQHSSGLLSSNGRIFKLQVP